jgi:hypothetical protein
MRISLLICLLLAAPGVLALTPAAKEFIEVTKQLEPVQCRKRQLRRQIALAEIEKRDAEVVELRGKFAALDRDPRTTKLEKRLAELEHAMRSGPRDPDDMQAISLQQREAFYKCE